MTIHGDADTTLPTIWWEPRVPKEVRAALEPIVLRWLHLLPTWVHQVLVKYDPENGDSALMGSEPQYRRAFLTVTGWFLRADAEERDSVVRHEFCHVPLHPLTDWTKDLIHRFAEDDQRLRDWLMSEWQERLEAATADVEMALQRTRRSPEE